MEYGALASIRDNISLTLAINDRKYTKNLLILYDIPNQVRNDYAL